MAEIIKKLNEPFLVDRVITPFGKYIVVSYKVKHYSKPETTFTRDTIFSATPESIEEAVLEINKFAVKHPHIVIKEQKEIGHRLDLPYGSIKQILNQQSIEQATQTFQRRQIEYIEEMSKKWKRVEHSVPTLDECRKIVQIEFPLSIRDQLVKRTAHNYLNWNQPQPPFTFTSDIAERGFVIVGNGVLSNCGYGTGEAIFYKVLSLEPEQKNSETTFKKQTLKIEEILNSHIQPLLPSALYSQKINELKQRGIIINYEGSLAFLPITIKQKEALERTNTCLITD